MNDNVVQRKSFEFATRIIRLYQHLSQDQKEFILSKQVLRSGTSIGANVEEAIGGQTKKDFISKFSVAYKESRETIYWLKLLRETNYLNQTQSASLIDDCNQLASIIAKILKTSKNS